MAAQTPPHQGWPAGVPPREEWPPGATWVAYAPNSGEFHFGYTGDGSPPIRGPVRHVRLSPDYGAPSPLWPNSDEVDELVSPELLERLVAWQLVFDDHFRYDTGWRSPEVKERWARQASELERELRLELRPEIQLEVDLWPLEPDDRTAP